MVSRTLSRQNGFKSKPNGLFLRIIVLWCIKWRSRFNSTKAQSRQNITLSTEFWMTNFVPSVAFIDHLSLRAKVNITVGVTFLIVLLFVTSFAVIHERDRLMEAAENQVKEITTLYFDSLNTMMLTGTMDQRSILRNKMLARKEVVEARVVRGQPVIGQFGPGYPDEKPVDELDHRALLHAKLDPYFSFEAKKIFH